MPGDRVQRGPDPIAKANTIFQDFVHPAAARVKNGQIVTAVCGGSDVGKSEIASLLSHYFRSAEMGSYTLCDSNCPWRIPDA